MQARTKLSQINGHFGQARNYVLQLHYLRSLLESTLFVKRVDLKNLRDEHTFSAPALLIPVFHLHLSFEVEFIKQNVNDTFLS
jgi:hypothetical protein